MSKMSLHHNDVIHYMKTSNVFELREALMQAWNYYHDKTGKPQQKIYRQIIDWKNPNHGDDTAVIAAAKKGHHLCLRILAQRKADLTLWNKEGKTALMCSIEAGNFECFFFLLKHLKKKSVVTRDFQSITNSAEANLASFETNVQEATTALSLAEKHANWDRKSECIKALREVIDEAANQENCNHSARSSRHEAVFSQRSPEVERRRSLQSEQASDLSSFSTLSRQPSASPRESNENVHNSGGATEGGKLQTGKGEDVELAHAVSFDDDPRAVELQARIYKHAKHRKSRPLFRPDVAFGQHATCFLLLLTFGVVSPLLAFIIGVSLFLNIYYMVRLIDRLITINKEKSKEVIETSGLRDKAKEYASLLEDIEVCLVPSSGGGNDDATTKAYHSKLYNLLVVYKDLHKILSKHTELRASPSPDFFQQQQQPSTEQSTSPLHQDAPFVESTAASKVSPAAPPALENFKKLEEFFRQYDKRGLASSHMASGEAPLIENINDKLNRLEELEEEIKLADKQLFFDCETINDQLFLDCNDLSASHLSDLRWLVLFLTSFFYSLFLMVCVV